MAVNCSNFPADASGAQIVIAQPNSNRMGMTIYNEPGTGVGSLMRILVSSNRDQILDDKFTVKLYPSDYYELPYTGSYFVIVKWETGDLTSKALVTDYT